ncbi:hypothetical protein PFISCL1PPCAC_7407, partial [Pristionchus fissidentatus]
IEFRMSEGNSKPAETGNQRVGKGALPSSNRREFRRFKPRKTTTTDQPVPLGPVPLPGTIDGTLDSVPDETRVGTQQKKAPRPLRPRPCRFFNSAKGCNLGDECSFAHRPKPTVAQPSEEDAVPGQEATVPGKVVESGPAKPRKRPPARCRNFNTENGCKLGDGCPFRHLPQREMEVVPMDTVPVPGTIVEPGEVVQPARDSTSAPRARAMRPQEVTVTSEQTGSEEQKRIMETEVNYLKRRFKGTEVSKMEEEVTVVRFTYDITEPDWPFDTRTVRLSLLLETCHPIEAPTILCRAVDNPGTIPHVVANHVGKTLRSEIETRHAEFAARGAYGAYGKWLIHRVDKMILNLFIDGLRKLRTILEAQSAGISLVMPSEDEEEEMGKRRRKKRELADQLADVAMEEEEDDEEDDDSDESEEEGDGSGRRVKTIEEGEEDGEGEEGGEKKKGQRPSMEMQIAWTNSSGNVATLEADALRFVLKCARCGEVREEDIKVVDGSGKRTARCGKCSHAQSIEVTRSIVHAQCATLALILAQGCRPIDAVLLHSQLRFVCLQCSKMDTVQNLSFGSAHKSWCRGCHALIEFTIVAARFAGLFGREQDEEAAKSVPKARKPKAAKESSGGAPIVEGEPLPDKGTCRHYKKSYRWFRFPCCGRLFPCDTCHEEAVVGDHEMKVANRMVCGHCSHEQPYSASKPCSACDAATTRKKSQFWEGGKGCRDQKNMSKNDTHKHVGGRKKTLSKKAWANRLEKKK